MRSRELIKLFKGAYKGYGRKLGVLGVLGFLGGFLEGVGITAVIPLFSKFIGSSGAGSDIISPKIEEFVGLFGGGASVKLLLLFIVCVFILKAAVLFLSRVISLNIAANYERERRSELLGSALRANWSFLLTQKIGHLETLLSRDISASKGVLTDFGTGIIRLSSLIIYVALALNVSFIVTILSLALGGAIFFILKPFLRYTRRLSEQVAKTNSYIAHHVNENIVGMKNVKAYATEDAIAGRARKYFGVLRDAQVKINIFNQASSAIIEPLTVMFVIGIFSITYLSGNFELGAFVVTMYLVNRIFQGIEALQKVLYKINNGIPFLTRFRNFQCEVESHKEQAIKCEKPFLFEKQIEFQNIVFSYPGKSENVLSNFSLRVKPGEMIGLVGESGAGKTTIVDLLLRLFEPQEGKILIDGVPISGIDIREWRKNIGYVAQEVFIINDTIENNIAFYNGTLSSLDIEYGARAAYLYDFIQNLPDKFKTQVGERGVMLSGGERQRLALARALARRSKILLLDEATSGLDNKSELIIQKSIEELKGKMTIFIIAHRLEMLMNCDRLLCLKDGQVSEIGSPKSLLDDESTYFHKLYNIRKNVMGDA